MRWSLCTLVLLVGPLAASAQTLPGFPAYLKVPPGLRHLNDGNLEVVDFKTQEFPAPGDKTVSVAGKYYFNYVTADARLARDWSDPARLFGAIKAALLAGGWSQLVATGPSGAVFRFSRPPVNAWAEVSVNDETTSWIRVVEQAAQGVALTLPPPAPAPENVPGSADLPYLLHYPGSTMYDSQQLDTPLDVTSSKDSETVLVGAGHSIRYYDRPDNVSAEQFETVYEAALRAAGWTIVERRQGLLAHYAKGARDIWVRLGSGDHLSFAVADVGRALAPSALKTALDTGCHVPVYGVRFDFNKATLRPDAEPALARILGLLQLYPDLALELQGHTDNVGTRAYNQGLSEQRVASVKAWLVAKGVAATRLSTRGFANTVPVAPNTNEEGRARNRRVEIAKPGCVPSGKPARASGD